MENYPEEFYVAVAGLIPIFVLAGVIEIQGHRRNGAMNGHSVQMLVAMSAMFVTAMTGEALTLEVLRRGDAPDIVGDILLASLVAMIALLNLLAAMPFVDSALEQGTRPRHLVLIGSLLCMFYLAFIVASFL